MDGKREEGRKRKWPVGRVGGGGGGGGGRELQVLVHVHVVPTKACRCFVLVGVYLRVHGRRYLGRASSFSAVRAGGGQGEGRGGGGREERG